MNHLLSLSALLLLAAPVYATEAKLYGSVKYGLNYQVSTPNYDHAPLGSERAARSSLTALDTHIGVRGSHDLGNGNKVIYQLEQGTADYKGRGHKKRK